MLAISGGGAVTVQGKGFDTAAGTGLVCRFTCTAAFCSSSFVESGAPSVTNSSELQCVAPAWTHAAGSAATVPVALTLVRADAIALFASATVSILYTKARYAAPGTQHKSTVGGGLAITITGEGFCHTMLGDSCDTFFVCEFRGVADRTQIARPSVCLAGGAVGEVCASDAECPGSVCTFYLSSTTTHARVVNDTAMVCTTPAWPYPPAVAVLTIKDGTFGTDVAFPQGVPLPWSGAQISTLFCAETIAIEQSMPVTGGLNFSIRAGGLALSDNFTCIVSLPGEEEEQGARVSTQAHVLSTRSIICLAPPWPKAVAAAGADVEVWDGEFCLSCLGAALTLFYVPRWEGFITCVSALPLPCRISSGPALGNFTLEVAGWGLDPLTPHEVRFTDAARHVLAIPLKFDQNGTSPPGVTLDPGGGGWAHAAANTSVTLHQFVGSAWVEMLGTGAAAGGVYFAFLPSLGARVGGGALPLVGCAGSCWPATVTISGEGFDASARHDLIQVGAIRVRNFTDMACLLTSPSGESLRAMLVSVDEETLLRCLLGGYNTPPAFVWGEGYRVSVESHGEALPWVGAPATVSMREAWTDSSCSSAVCTSSSAGGAVVSIAGFGFSADGVYQCSFGGENASAVNVVTPFRIECTSPEWRHPAAVVPIALYKAGVAVAFEGAPGLTHQVAFDSAWWFETLQYGSVLGGAAGEQSLFPGGFAPHPTITFQGRGLDLQGATFYATLSGTDNNGARVQV